jgi:hypothetical protein
MEMIGESHEAAVQAPPIGRGGMGELPSLHWPGGSGTPASRHAAAGTRRRDPRGFTLTTDDDEMDPHRDAPGAFAAALLEFLNDLNRAPAHCIGALP